MRVAMRENRSLWAPLFAAALRAVGATSSAAPGHYPCSGSVARRSDSKSVRQLVPSVPVIVKRASVNRRQRLQTAKASGRRRATRTTTSLCLRASPSLLTGAVQGRGNRPMGATCRDCERRRRRRGGRASAYDALVAQDAHVLQTISTQPPADGKHRDRSRTSARTRASNSHPECA